MSTQDIVRIGKSYTAANSYADDRVCIKCRNFYCINTGGNDNGREHAVLILKCLPLDGSNSVRKGYAAKLVVPECTNSDTGNPVRDGDTGKLVNYKCVIPNGKRAGAGFKD